jgi:sulfotransferase family protein
MMQHEHEPRISFLIAGVQKAGTTALSRFLAAHPALYLAKHESHFFDKDAVDWDRPDYAPYEKRFRAAKPDQLVGEKTPIYLFWDHVLDRIQAYNPAMRLIVSLRNPADRAYSHWKMETRRGHETRSFSYAIRDGRARINEHDGGRHTSKRRFSYVERGFYAGQIKRALALFPREQLFVLTNDGLAGDQKGCLDRLCRFLQIDAFEKYPPSERIFPQQTKFDQMDQGAPVKVAPPLAEDSAYLNDLYRDDILETASLTGLDLRDWLAD